MSITRGGCTAGAKVDRFAYRPALDGVRGIAILAVLAFHLFPGTGGADGVTLFFVLSGFLITTLLLDEHDRTGTISLRSFYERRARRLLPALVVTLIMFLVLNGAARLVVGGAGVSPSTALLSVGSGLFFVANEAVEYGRQAPGLVHLWSLGMEEQFYAVWPLSLLLLLRRPRVGRIGIALMVFALGIAGYETWVAAIGFSATPQWVWPLFHAAPIAIGCAAAVAVRRWPLPGLWIRIGASVALPLVVFWLVFGRVLRPGAPYSSLADSGFWLTSAALIAAVSFESREVLAGRLLSARWLVALGKVSFGLYLFHPLLTRTTPWLTTWEGELLSIPLAFASFYLYERRFTRRSRTRSAAPVAVAAAA